MQTLSNILNIDILFLQKIIIKQSARRLKGKFL